MYASKVGFNQNQEYFPNYNVYKTILNSPVEDIASAINDGFRNTGVQPKNPIDENTLRQLNPGLFDEIGYLKGDAVDRFNKLHKKDFRIDANSKLREYSEAIHRKIQELKMQNKGKITRRFDILA